MDRPISANVSNITTVIRGFTNELAGAVSHSDVPNAARKSPSMDGFQLDPFLEIHLRDFFSSSYQNFTSRSRPLYVESLVTLNGRIHEVRSGMKEPQSWRCGDFLHMVCFGAITKRPCENDGVSW